ncbi:CsbD family protein [Actinomadura sp. NAK00032]|uniref:CsbD family protein n=1 Tax=Actinomadura sp. NAK00032 TaxID=2742128 RepID=UPI001590F23D|nr:CsbD family protein [Actinomadura sp. NAK00032]QKW34367.1 CsbD family protein [Actinomadura sp. NAK00032]
MSFLDKLKNKTQKAMGQGKEEAGRQTGDRSMEAEGRRDQAAGGTKQVGEKAKDAAQEARRTFGTGS